MSDEQANTEAAHEIERSLQNAIRTLRSDAERLGDLPPGERVDAAEQLVSDAADLDAQLAEADAVDPDPHGDAAGA